MGALAWYNGGGGGGGGRNHLITNVGLYLTVVDKAINHDQWWDISDAHTMHCAGCIKPHPHRLLSPTGNGSREASPGDKISLHSRCYRE